MLYEERLTREILARAPMNEPFDVELFDDRECDLIEDILMVWGCRVRRVPNKLRLIVWASAECADWLPADAPAPLAN